MTTANTGNCATAGVKNVLKTIFGTSDGKRLWVVGGGTILESSDGGKHWELRDSGTTEYLYSIFGTSDGSRPSQSHPVSR